MRPFVQRDPLGVWGDSLASGQSRNFGGSDPLNHIDPSGAEIVPDPEMPVKKTVSDSKFWCFLQAWYYFMVMPPIQLHTPGPTGDVVTGGKLQIYEAVKALPPSMKVTYAGVDAVDVGDGGTGRAETFKDHANIDVLTWNCPCTTIMKAQMVRTLVHESLHVLADWSGTTGVPEVDRLDGLEPSNSPNLKRPKDAAFWRMIENAQEIAQEHFKKNPGPINKPTRVR